MMYIVLYFLEVIISLISSANYCNWSFQTFRIVKKRAAYWESLKSFVKIKKTPKVEENRSLPRLFRKLILPLQQIIRGGDRE